MEKTLYPIFRMLWMGHNPVGLILCNRRNVGAMDGVVAQCGFSNYKEFVQTYPGKMKNQSKVHGRGLGWNDNDYVNNKVPKIDSRSFYDISNGDCDTLRLMQYKYVGTISSYQPYDFFLYPTLEDVSKTSYLQHFCVKDFWFCSDWNEDWLDSDDGQKSLRQIIQQQYKLG